MFLIFLYLICAQANTIRSVATIASIIGSFFYFFLFLFSSSLHIFRGFLCRRCLRSSFAPLSYLVGNFGIIACFYLRIFSDRRGLTSHR